LNIEAHYMKIYLYQQVRKPVKLFCGYNIVKKRHLNSRIEMSWRFLSSGEAALRNNAARRCYF